ncbi:hypothetical protein F4604DRAFT_1685464 [Suillus subluteus]|nr:hypothetical protein F4604DRAFT_1685464 [Suillus subluteus]
MWVKRNSDVLVQLLQSDEPEEVPIVKTTLCDYLDMNPDVTLGVLPGSAHRIDLLRMLINKARSSLNVKKTIDFYVSSTDGQCKRWLTITIASGQVQDVIVDAHHTIEYLKYTGTHKLLTRTGLPLLAKSRGPVYY